ncbi:hypothetical protein FI667_g6231, partial [Globisporangium splendens]
MKSATFVLFHTNCKINAEKNTLSFSTGLSTLEIGASSLHLVAHVRLQERRKKDDGFGDDRERLFICQYKRHWHHQHVFRSDGVCRADAIAAGAQQQCAQEGDEFE